ncbi:MAG: response regulator [Chloroflexota bacterium]|nr:response regulator [Chloroflexota bacterium]
MTATILVVEDDAAVREVILEVLTDEGYQTHSAVDGEQALTIASEQHIDLLLTDGLMPRMDGPELVRRLRALAPELPVVLVSAHPSYASSECPDISFLGKPFAIPALLDLLDSLLQGRSP